MRASLRLKKEPHHLLLGIDVAFVFGARFCASALSMY